MPTDYLAAILHWRRHHASLDLMPSSTISTMLYACLQWLDTDPGKVDSIERRQVIEIKQELESWLATRDLVYRG